MRKKGTSEGALTAILIILTILAIVLFVIAARRLLIKILIGG